MEFAIYVQLENILLILHKQNVKYVLRTLNVQDEIRFG